MVHFHWGQLLGFLTHHQVHIASSIVVFLLCAVFATLSKTALGGGRTAIVPTGKFSIRAVFELLFDFNLKLTQMVVGDKGLHMAPLFAALFSYILLCNIFSLFPGFTPPTDNINTTLAVGLFSFIMYNWYGLKEHGIKYFKQFLGPILWLAPLMVVIELISHLVRPFSLGLRLQGNMMGDHLVLSIFLDLVPYGVPIIFYGLGLFVSFMQAFVFTMLSMIYVALSISHDH